MQWNELVSVVVFVDGVPILIGVLTVLSVAAAVVAYKLKRATHRPKDMESVQYHQLLQNSADDEEENDHVDDL